MTSLHHGENGDLHTRDDLAVTTSKSDPFRSQIRVVGDLDIATCDLLRAVLEQQLALGRRYVRVDVSAVPFMDSTGATVLLEAHHAFLAERGTMIILGASPRLRRLLALLDLDHVLFLAADTACSPAILRAVG